MGTADKKFKKMFVSASCVLQEVKWFRKLFWLLKNMKKNDGSRSSSAKTTRSNTSLESTGNKAVIRGRDGNSKL